MVKCTRTLLINIFIRLAVRARDAVTPPRPLALVLAGVTGYFDARIFFQQRNILGYYAAKRQYILGYFVASTARARARVRARYDKIS